MCVIIVAPKGIEKKSKFLIEAIKVASITNKDGIGFMYKEGDSILLEKGFKTADAAIEALNNMEMSDAAGILAIHLRIGNKGAVNAEMCHPFVCSEEAKEVTVTSAIVTDKPVLMHNGTFTNIPLPSGKSDTHEFAHKFMSETKVSDLFYSDPELFSKIGAPILGLSRVIIFYPDNRDFQKVGNWIEDEGYLFSNTTYKNSNIRNIGGVEVAVGKQMALPLGKSGKTKASRVSSSIRESQRTIGSGNNVHVNNHNCTIGNVLTSGYTRLIGENYFDKIIKENNSIPDIDTLGFTVLKYRGMVKYPERNYVKDTYSLEILPNKYNYKYLKLQGKTDITSMGLRDGAYYKITKVLTNETTGEELYEIDRSVYNMEFKPFLLSRNNITELFSVRPSNTPESDTYFSMYLDLVGTMNDYKKVLNRLVQSFKNKKDSDFVQCGKRKNPFPVFVIKWFIHETKLHQNVDILQINKLINNK